MHVYITLLFVLLFVIFLILYLKEKQHVNVILKQEAHNQHLLTKQLEQTVGEKDLYLKEKIDLGHQLSVQKVEYTHLKEQLEKTVEQQQKLMSDNRIQFEHLSNKILEEKASKFARQNQDSLNQLLQPFQERMKDFEKKVDETYQNEARERIGLQKEINQIFKLNQTLSQQADNLTKALKSDSKSQGNWGEYLLAKILESAGLQEGIHYESQLTITGEKGKKLRPDVVIYLPEKKHVIIDSKVSLTAYERYFNCTEEAEKEIHLKGHLRSVKQHIDELAQKKYERFLDASPDFVLMFVPVEPAYNLALMADPGLYEYGFRKQIILVSVSSLLATLRIIESIWRLEKQNKNAAEIVEEGNKLYDKFVSFVSDMEEIGGRLNGAEKAFEKAMNKLSEGRGNLIRRAEKMRNLGLNPSKRLPGEQE